MRETISAIFSQSAEVRDNFLARSLDDLVQVVEILTSVIKGGRTIFIFGNGGSAADAQHMAAEFINRYMVERGPLPAIALTTDTSVITSIANDYNYDEIFAKQIKALGKEGDAALGISTSGSSKNVIRGFEVAKEKKMITVGLGGDETKPMKSACDHYLAVNGNSTARIQETHEIICHTIVEILEKSLNRDGL